MSRKQLLFFPLSLVLIFSVSCNSAEKTETITQEIKDLHSTTSSDQKGYLATYNDGVIFLQYVEIDKKLKGQIQFFYTRGSRYKEASNNRVLFEGISDGHNINIIIDEGIWSSIFGNRSINGIINNSELTLTMPSDNGLLIPVKFKVSSVDDYNNAVLNITKIAQTINQQVEKVDSEAAQRNAEQQAVSYWNQQVFYSMNVLNETINTILVNQKFELIFNDYSANISNMQNRIKEIKSKASKTPLNEYDIDHLGYELDHLKYDLDHLLYVSDNLTYKFELLKNTIKTGEEEIIKLQNSWNNLKQATSNNKSGYPQSKYSESDIVNQINRTQAIFVNTSQLIQNTTKKAQEIESQGKELYAQSETFVHQVKNNYQ